MTTSVQKLDCVISTLTILMPRLNEPYYSDVKTCIGFLKDIRANIDECANFDKEDEND